MRQARRTTVVRMFGPLGLELAGSRLGPGDLGGVKPKQLLEVLLLERGRAVSKDRLADRLWGERPPQRATATIESYVSVLRRGLDGGRGLGRRLILTEHGGYRLAEQIPGARLVELPGVDHDPWVGDTGPVLAAVEEFLATLPVSASQGFSKVATRSSRERKTTTEVS